MRHVRVNKSYEADQRVQQYARIPENVTKYGYLSVQCLSTSLSTFAFGLSMCKEIIVSGGEYVMCELTSSMKQIGSRLQSSTISNNS